MGLIRGVALIISGETARYERRRRGGQGAARGRTIGTSSFVMARCP